MPKCTHRLFVALSLAATLVVVVGSATSADNSLQKGTSDETLLSLPWSDGMYFFVPGGVLRPRDSDVTWNYHAGGCISMPGGNEWFTLRLDLPQGSRIEYLRLYAFDDDVGYVRAHIMSYDGLGTASTLTTVDSTGTGGYGSDLSDYLGHVANNYTNGYSLLARPSTNSTNLRICGLRVMYRVPVTGIFADGFESGDTSLWSSTTP